MKYLVSFLLLVLMLSCSNSPETTVKQLNGYWEIEKVTLADGSVREYKFNQTIDYFNISNSLTGFRIKLKPNFSGTFETSNNKEQIQVKLERDSINLYYKTPYTNWKETVLKVSEQQLQIVNQDKNIYQYKRYTPLNLD
ncbi:hypothetical protein [Mangrovimonas aestuarii]|uniref:hypothetical protein n=1 Tax=Mangrovimonas aestuarii TaxID=3018443 RepID=UPI002379D66A|nr:hypothetical protein [Mangrovimonas aestuarii]